MLLIGLVFMQVSLLKLNAGMGADVEKAAALERGNAMLQADVSKLESNDRIQQLAIRAGMVLPTSDNVRYLGAGGKRVGGADATAAPSQGEASTALLPTVPDAAAPEGTGVTTPTTTEPQTTSSVPDAALAQQQADAAAAAAAGRGRHDRRHHRHGDEHGRDHPGAHHHRAVHDRPDRDDGDAVDRHDDGGHRRGDRRRGGPGRLTRWA